MEVRKYVLPKFRISLELDEPFYQPGQTGPGDSGLPILLSASRSRRPMSSCRPFHKMPRLVWWLNCASKTNENGQTRFQFPLPNYLVGRQQTRGNANLDLLATVTDTAGQQHMVKTSRIVARQPLSIEVIPENGQLVANVPNRVYVYVTYPDGRPAQARVMLSSTGQEITTDELGVAVFEHTPNSGQMSLHLKATDAEGRSRRTPCSIA